MNRRITMLIGATLLGFLITAPAAFAQNDRLAPNMTSSFGMAPCMTGPGRVPSSRTSRFKETVSLPLAICRERLDVRRWMQPASLSPLGSSTC
jgi:hypothetical protein